MLHHVISETGRTSNCTDWRTDHTLRGDTRQTQPRATATSTVRAETMVDNHVTKVEPGTHSVGVLAMAAVTVVCAAVVLV